MAEKGRSIHVDGVKHGAPIPMGARGGNMIFSSGSMGADPVTGTVPEDLESQCVFAFANMKTMVENAGGTIKNIGTIKVYMKDRSQRAAVQGASPATDSGMSCATRTMGIPVWVLACISSMARGRSSKA